MRRQHARVSEIRRSQNTQTHSAGNIMTGRPPHRDPEVARLRMTLQRKYDLEAKEADEKQKRKEQQKREEWLKRQEALVRPGYRLGSGQLTPQPNHARDLLEQEACVENPEWGRENLNQRSMDEQYDSLVEQRQDRDREFTCFARRLEQTVQPTQDRNEAGAKGKTGTPGSSRSQRKGVLPKTAQSYTTSVNRSPGSVMPANFLGAYQAPPRESVGAPGQLLGRNDVNQSKDETQEDKTGYILGSGNPSPAATNPNANGGEQLNHREQMLAARRRMQERYNAELQRAENPTHQEVGNVAGNM